MLLSCFHTDSSVATAPASAAPSPASPLGLRPRSAPPLAPHLSTRPALRSGAVGFLGSGAGSVWFPGPMLRKLRRSARLCASSLLLSPCLCLPLSPSLSSPSAKLKRSECERARSPGPPRAHLLQLRAPAALAGRARADTFTCSGVKLMDMEISPTTGAEVPRDFSSRSRYSYPPARAHTHL